MTYKPHELDYVSGDILPFPLTRKNILEKVLPMPMLYRTSTTEQPTETGIVNEEAMYTNIAYSLMPEKNLPQKVAGTALEIIINVVKSTQG